MAFRITNPELRIHKLDLGSASRDTLTYYQITRRHHCKLRLHFAGGCIRFWHEICRLSSQVYRRKSQPIFYHGHIHWNRLTNDSLYMWCNQRIKHSFLLLVVLWCWPIFSSPSGLFRLRWYNHAIVSAPVKKSLVLWENVWHGFTLIETITQKCVYIKRYIP